MKEERLFVSQQTDVLSARRLARETAMSLGFDHIAVTETEIAVSELATNLVKHKTIKGEIIIRVLENEDRLGLEIRSEDQGPGIKDLASAMREGESTAGTLGIGLLGVKRLMDEFSITSQISTGTVVVARKWLYTKSFSKMQFSVLSRPKPGENSSGDAYFIKNTPSWAIWAVIDVLGHGEAAHEIALKIIKMLEDNYTQPLESIINICHQGLRHTRGAAMALGRLDLKRRLLEHISIGNVETRILGSAEAIRPICFNGTLGMAMERHKVIEYPFPEGATVIMFSDGIIGRFDLSAVWSAKTPQEIASFIFEHYFRGSDDATVLVGR